MSSRNSSCVRGPLTTRDRALVNAGINLALRDSSMREARALDGERRARYVQYARCFNRIAITFRKLGVQS